MTGTLRTFSSRPEAELFISAMMEGVLRLQLEHDVHAGLLLSGGSTPGPVYERLSRCDIDWTRVDVGLVDERWVEQGDARSNAGLLAGTLFQNQAASAHFLPMKTPDATPAAGAPKLETRYGRLLDLGPLVMLGMGTDGHTASWFPGVPGIEQVMDPDTAEAVAAIDATGSAVAGDMPHRITVTGRALEAASIVILYITGHQKRRVLENRAANLPIHMAEDILGDRLVEVWAP
ncbi:MAG: 6-phosphogluconolactonase [Pseudomonadota bacterium]